MELSKGEGGRRFGGGLPLLSGAKRRQEELEWFQNHDTFTSMPNFHMLQQDFTQLKQRDHWAVALIHIDRFNDLNSIFGTDLGGQTIQRICPILSDFAEQSGGRAYRITVDRLVVLCPAADLSSFQSELERTLENMEGVYVEDKHTVYSYHYTFSYAAYILSDSPEDYQRIESVLEFTEITRKRLNADSGRRGAVYDRGTKPNWAQSETLQEEVRTAWKNREFIPYFQPVYDLRSQRPIGAELLIRWRHPQRGLISPGDFFPLIEAEGLMMDMDLYMLEAACQKIRGWMNAELLTIPLSINICKQNIHRTDFLPRLIEIVMSYEIPPVLIELELNEEAILFEKNEAFLYLMDQMHRVGFTLTMDDCGASELSSINLLRDLPMDAVKINHRFLKDVERSDRDRIFVTNILRMASELGVKAIATGIETQEQADTWLKLGCSLGQGFHLSKPLSNEEFEALIF